ncbi:MAG: cytochrome P450, partial [Acidimicrobiales bacterium]
MELQDIDLSDSRNFVDGVPHHWFAHLRREAPVQWHPDPNGLGDGFWCVTRYDDCVTINRDYEHFSSARAGVLFHDMDEEQLGSMRLMMLNMDPPMHTRYRRLVSKGFTPRMIRDLEAKVVASTDGIINGICETGSADFVEQISAELPLQVIADLMGVPQSDRHLVFDWSNHMIGSEDPEFATSVEAAEQASMELYAYADELCEKKRADPHADLFSVLTQSEIEGDSLSQLELDLFFLLLAVAGNETTRNLISGAMVAFFDHPEQWDRLLADRSLLPSAIEEMLRYVTPVMHFRRQATMDWV